MSSNINNTFTSGTGPAPNTQGPHKSDMLNRADPRVDSDLDGSRTLGGNTSTGTHVPEGTYGSHKSRAANVADPRIDSDNDRTAGLNSHGASTGMTGSGMTGSGMTGSGMTGTHHRSGAGAGSGYEGGLSRGIHEGGLTHGTHEGAHGPHSLRAANATDPRVDSDLDGSRTIGNKTGASAAHTGGHSTTAGERVVGATAGTLGGPKHTGPAPNTAGPHKSDFLNKIDPRVDSNLDGSKTFGGDKTYSQ